jgi:8-oxo-dGTP pyrophosphatase MutT (NUDIX family)
MSNAGHPEIRAAGVLLMVPGSPPSFLLMDHGHRLDLPKGHLEDGETDLEGALREMEEETGIPRAVVSIDPVFRHEIRYRVREIRYGREPRNKVVVIFLGWLAERAQVVATEHAGHRWYSWISRQKIQAQTIDEVLNAVENHFGGKLPGPAGGLKASGVRPMKVEEPRTTE